jgi:hypothetical protein
MVAIFVIGNDLPENDCIYAHIQFTIVNQLHAKDSVSPEAYFYILSSKDTRHNHTNSGGHINVLNEKELHNPSKGFIGMMGKDLHCIRFSMLQYLSSGWNERNL